MLSRHAIVTCLILLALTLESAAADTLRWTLATGLPDGSKARQKLERETRKLARQTDGRMQLKVSGVGDGGGASFPRILSGDAQPDAALVPAFEYAELVPEAAIYGRPFLFDDIAEARAIRKRFDTEFVRGIQHDDYVVFGVIGLGFLYLMSDHPFAGMAGIKDTVVHVPFDAGWMVDMLSSLSLKPRHDVPVSDAMLMFNSPAALILDKRLHRPDFVVVPPVQYGYMLLLVRRALWEGLAAGDRQILDVLFTNVVRELDAATDNGDARAIRLLQKRGMQMLPLPEEDVARMRNSNPFVLPDNPLQKRLDLTLDELRGSTEAVEAAGGA